MKQHSAGSGVKNVTCLDLKTVKLSLDQTTVRAGVFLCVHASVYIQYTWCRIHVCLVEVTAGLV